MAAVPAADQPVPDDEADEEEEEEPFDLWAAAGQQAGDAPSPTDAAEYRQFLQFLNRRGGARRGRAEADDEDDDDKDSRSNAGPPPTWDGSTPFRDYVIRARLWLATTKTKPQSRGPMLLRNLSGVPFDDMKYLAKDDKWMKSKDNGEKLLKVMDTRELYGDDEREDMLNSLFKITYATRRQKNEGHKEFFSRWEIAIRKLSEHNITLPPEYLGFLLTMALQLNQEEVKLLMNFTQGKLSQKDVKEWVRVHETNLDLRSTTMANAAAKTKVTAAHHVESSDIFAEPDHDFENETEDGGIEVLLNAMENLGDDALEETEDDGAIFDEDEAREILSTMVKEHAKKRTFAAVNEAKKQKNLARGYGSGARQVFGKGSGKGAGKSGFKGGFEGSYKVSIEAIKRRTKCANCQQVGHWHRECPHPNRRANKGDKEHTTHLLETGAHEAHFLGFEDFLRIKKVIATESDEQMTYGGATSSSSHRRPVGPASVLSAYKERLPVHDVWFLSRSSQPLPDDDATCATVDTGCQRSAVGSETLQKLLEHQPPGLRTIVKNEVHHFKSINGISKTDHVACIPTSLGPKGCLLRPAVFEDEATRKAPFLLSLPFLLHCRSVLHLVLSGFRCTGSLEVCKPNLAKPWNNLNRNMMLINLISLVKIGSASHPVLPYLHVIPDLSIISIMPAQKRSRTQKKKQDLTESELAWNRMVLRMIMSCIHAISTAILSHLGVRGPKHILIDQVLGELPQLTGNELHQLNHAVNQHLERRALEHTKDEQWDARKEWSRQTTPDAEMEGPGETEFILVEHPVATQSVVENNRATIRCFCNQPTVVLQTRKEGRNQGRLFRRCPLWRNTSTRCTFFSWLEHQPYWQPSPENVGHYPGMASARSSDEIPPPVNYPRAPQPSPTTPVMSEISLESGFTLMSVECQHKTTTYAGSNAFVRQVKCRDCGKILKKEKCSPGPRQVPAEQEHQSPTSPSSFLRSPSGTSPVDYDPARPRGPPPPQPVGPPPQAARNPKGNKGQNSSSSSHEMQEKSDWDEYREFKKWQALKNGHDLLKRSVQHSVLTYIKQERPLVVVSPPCEAFSVLNRLLDNFRKTNVAAMKRHLAKLKQGKILLNFAMQVCQVCHDQGSTFVFEHPRGASSWKMPSVQRLLRQAGVILALADQCVFGLTDRQGQLHKKPTGFVTNNKLVGEALAKRCGRDHNHAWIWGSKAISKRAQNYPPKLVDAILESYSRSIGKAPQEVQVQTSGKILSEDLRHDANYFAPLELEEIEENFENPVAEVMVGEADEPEPPEVLEEIKPEALGVTQDLVVESGWKPVPMTKRWLYVGENEPEVAVPTADNEARKLPWRSTWTRAGGRWVVLEDEIRWQDLGQAPRLEPNTSYISVYQQRLDDKADKKMRHFPGMAKVTLERMIRRAHEGLGHPEHGRFMRILRQSNASEEVLDAAQQFQCATCQAYRLPEAVRKGAPPKEELYINEKVGVDTVHLRDHNNDAVPSLNIIDFHTHFQLVIPMAAESASEVRKAYRQWIRFFGVPRKVLFDLGTEFKAEFRRQVENDGSEALPSSLETPTQRGLTERAGGVFKDILYKSMIDYHCQSREEWKELVDIACMTRNRLLLRGGYSPIQRVIGYTPRLPGGLLTGGADDHTHAARMVVGDREVVRSMKMRKAAAVAFHAADCDQALRAATLAGPRKVFDFEVGQLVYFWRRGLFDADNDIELNDQIASEEQGAGVGLGSSSGLKREAEEHLDPPGKRSRMHLIETYHLHLQGLAKQRQKKESKASDFKGVDYERLQTAILKEINNNLGTQAYEILSREASQHIEQTKPEKIMESRYVITKKPLEPAEVSKAESEGVLLEVKDLIEANRISEEARKHSDLGIRVMPIPIEDLRVSVVTDAAWGNAKEQPWIEDSPDDYWEEQVDGWIRHHVQPRRTTFHPGAAPAGPDLHDLTEYRTIVKFDTAADGTMRKEVIEDKWSDANGIRVVQDGTWTGSSYFQKSKKEKLAASKVHSSLSQLLNLSSQGGQIVIYHDRRLSETETPAMTTVASWKSYRLKRKTVDTLAAEGQALQGGLGAVHWHRLLFMEALFGDLSVTDWRAVAGRLPFLAAVDSKSLYDAVNKCACTASYVSDKRTAIDLAVIKADLAETSGKIRWIDTRSMLSDPLTKQHPGTYLRYVLRHGFWSVMEEGHALQAKALEREARRANENLFLTIWESRV
ncbi:unnamed protein product [Symbiodinium necroappetens]|uniref:Copia protein n=1 Tax=Symbiodinium necroappetens TaxID=1628268 RepID=A0A812QGF8_9DINO|nr:unnamed protein product [Symbiodinium necroappetens]